MNRRRSPGVAPSAVTSPMLRSTCIRHTSSFAVIPSTQRCWRVVIPFFSISMDSKRDWAITGSMTFNSSWPASAARVTVRSFPMTLNAIWFTTSGITGLTFPGMMEDPGCMAGRLISLIPVRGPEESSRRSLQILESFTARRFSADEYITKDPVS